MHQRKTGQFIMARGMRKLMAKAEVKPSYLEKPFLEPYFVVIVDSPVSTSRTAPSATITVPPERQEAAR